MALDIFDIGGPQFGLADCKVAVNNGNGTFGTPVDVPSVQLLDMQLRIEKSELTGDNRITATASRIVGATIQLRFGSIHLDVLEVMLGTAIGYTYGDRDILIANKKLPRFGICGKAEAEEGGGDTHLFAPSCKIGANFSLKFEYNNFSIPEISLDAVGDENFLDDDDNPVVIIPVEYEDTQAVSLPPVAA